MLEGTTERAQVSELGSRPPYASSHRAVAACTRELARLHEAVVDGVTAWYVDDANKPVVRRSPARCLVQVGPVALTLAWLVAGQGTIADGELLVMVWKGNVATRLPVGFERTSDKVGASKATALWEDVFTVSATSEEAWQWASKTDGAPLTSAALADMCVAQLRDAYAAG